MQIRSYKITKKLATLECSINKSNKNYARIQNTLKKTALKVRTLKREKNNSCRRINKIIQVHDLQKILVVFLPTTKYKQLQFIFIDK